MTEWNEVDGALVPAPATGVIVKVKVGGWFRLEPGDHILFRLGSGPLAALETALLGSPWGHIAIKGRGTLIIESIGRGVLRRDIRACSGSHVRVLRPRSTLLGAGLRICEAAERIADNPQSWYDYLAIVQYVLPRLIAAKLHLPMPLKWHRNPVYVCSEFVEQADVDAGYPPECVLEGVIPLPGDFNNSPMLRWAWEGVLP